MLSEVWLLAAIACMAILAFIGFMLLFKIKRSPTDYRALFVLGIVWIAVGSHLQNYALIIIGLVLFTIGLDNKDLWEKNKTKWKKITKEEKRITALIMLLIVVVICIGLSAFSAL